MTSAAKLAEPSALVLAVVVASGAKLPPVRAAVIKVLATGLRY